MTEYWVSQGNKWCDFCKIYIANNPASIRTHEFGQRHKDNVSKKLAAIRKENASKEKEKQQALKDLERIEAQARRSYAKDLVAKEKLEASAAASTDDRKTHLTVPNTSPTADPLRSSSSNESNTDGEWTYDVAAGYYFNSATGYYFDPNSGLYYGQLLGKWTTQEEAFKASKESVGDASAQLSKTLSVPEQHVPVIPAGKLPQKRAAGVPSTEIPCPVLRASQIRPMPSKGVASSLAVGKRKSQGKTESLSKDEAAALAARQAAKNRIQEREKGLLGLYQSY